MLRIHVSSKEAMTMKKRMIGVALAALTPGGF
jgi:hypothetical protein